MVFAEVLRIQRRVHVGAGAHDSPFVRLLRVVEAPTPWVLGRYLPGQGAMLATTTYVIISRKHSRKS